MRRFLAAGFLILAATGSGPRAEDWPQYRGPQGDGVWRASGIVEKLPQELARRWSTPVGGGFAGPAVAQGRVYVCDRVLAPGEKLSEGRWDLKDPVNGNERVLCLDSAQGQVLWKHEYPCRYEISYPVGPRATPTVDGGRVYTLGAMGDLFCLDAATGKVIWSKNYVRHFGTEINPWGMAAAPLLDGPRLIVLPGGKNGACVVALDKITGAEIWRALESKDPGYSTPIIVDAGGARQLLVWLPIGLYSLDPATGKVYWSEETNVRMGHSIASPIFDPKDRLLFVTSFFNGPIMMRTRADRPAAELLWKGSSTSELPRRTEGLHGLMSTPVLKDGYLYGVCSYGHLRCLEAKTGKRVWETLAPTGENRWSTAFLIRHGDRFFLFNERGELILAELSPQGYREFGRARVLSPTMQAGPRKVVWSHPAFADRRIYARNDEEIVCIDLAER